MGTKANRIKPVRQKQAEEVMGRQAKTGPGESSHTLRSGAGRGRLELEGVPTAPSFPRVGRGQRAMLKCPRVMNPQCTRIYITPEGRQAAGAA